MQWRQTHFVRGLPCWRWYHSHWQRACCPRLRLQGLLRFWSSLSFSPGCLCAGMCQQTSCPARARRRCGDCPRPFSSGRLPVPGKVTCCRNPSGPGWLGLAWQPGGGLWRLLRAGGRPDADSSPSEPSAQRSRRARNAKACRHAGGDDLTYPKQRLRFRLSIAPGRKTWTLQSEPDPIARFREPAGCAHPVRQVFGSRTLRTS